MSGNRRLLSLPLAALLVAGLVALPVLTVALHVVLPDQGAWRHIVDVLLPEYLRNTLLLVAGTAVGVIALGLTTAWLVSVCRFPGRRLFEWALVLPLVVAVPAVSKRSFQEIGTPSSGPRRVPFRARAAAASASARLRKPILVEGPPGVGKTHLAVALGVKAVEAGTLKRDQRSILGIAFREGDEVVATPANPPIKGP